jgi:hypothetical protein
MSVRARGVTLEDLAKARGLHIDFLRKLGWEDATDPWQGRPAVRIPFKDEAGRTLRYQWRLGLEKGPGKDRRFRWDPEGQGVVPYGLEHLAAARSQGYIVLVEGATDTACLLQFGFPALGIPGVETWKKEWADYLSGLKVYAWQESDKAGERFIGKLGKDIPGLLIVKAPPEAKDPCELAVLRGREGFAERFTELLENAQPLASLPGNGRGPAETVSPEVQEAAQELLKAPDLLGRLVAKTQEMGHVGEERNKKLLFLAIVARLFGDGQAIFVRGGSSGGKSFLVDTVLALFPEEMVYRLTNASMRALFWEKERLDYRIMLVRELRPVKDNEVFLGALREALSSGVLDYRAAIAEGSRPVTVHISVPARGLLVIFTDTGELSEPELENRGLTTYIDESEEQTGRVLELQGKEAQGWFTPDVADLAVYRHALANFQPVHPSQVIVPYGTKLAENMPTGRLEARRDFRKLLRLIQASAYLHQYNRPRDEEGRIIATPEDYAIVREVAELAFARAVRGIGGRAEDVWHYMLEKHEKGEAWLSAASIGRAFGFSAQRAQVLLEALQEMGFVEDNGRPRGAKRWQALKMQKPVIPLPPVEIVEIPTGQIGPRYENISTAITTPPVEINTGISTPPKSQQSNRSCEPAVEIPKYISTPPVEITVEIPSDTTPNLGERDFNDFNTPQGLQKKEPVVRTCWECGSEVHHDPDYLCGTCGRPACPKCKACERDCPIYGGA